MPRKKIDPAKIEAAYLQNAFVPKIVEPSERLAGRKGASRILYIENKSGGEAHIGRVTYSKTGRTIYYRGRAFRSLKGMGFKSNYRELETGEHFWISGPRKDGGDRLYGERVNVKIDEDVREEYWCAIRNLPERRNDKAT